MITITYEGTNFNATHLSKFTKAEFVKEFESSKVYKNFSPADRKKLLEEAHAKCQEAVKKDEKPAEATPAK